MFAIYRRWLALLYSLTLLSAALLVPPLARAQEHGILEGSVLHAETHEALPGVHVYLEHTTVGAVTDEQGRYRFTAAAGPHILVARFIGFETQRAPVLLTAGGRSEQNFALTPETLLLQNVVVTATGERQSKADIAATIGTIDRNVIARVKPTHPAEILSRIPGVWINTTSGEGHMTAIRQPLTTEPVYLYLEDGVPTRSTGFFNHNALYEINVPLADGIEVIKGPGTALYGSDAIGGVINVTTMKAPLEPQGSLTLEGGSFGFGRLLATGGTTIGRSGLRLDLNLTRSDGWREATEYERQSATFRWDLRLPGNQKLKTVASFSNVDQEPAGASALSQEDFNADPTLNYTPISFRDVQALRLSTAYERFATRSTLSLTPYFRYNAMDILPNWSLAYDPAVWNSKNVSLGLLAKYRHTFEPMRALLVTGIDLDFSPGTHTERAVHPVREGKVFTSFTDGALIYDYDVTFRQAAPYVHGEFSPRERLRITGGLRFDVLGYVYDNHLSVVEDGRHRRAASTARTFSHLSPKLGVTYRFSPGLNAFAAYSHAFRVPSEGQLFRQGSTSNTLDLKPVRANNVEVGLRSQWTERVRAEVSLYTMTKTDDIVSFIDADGLQISMNAGKTRHRGIEIGLQVKPLDGLDLQGSYAYAQHTFEAWQPRAGLDVSGNEMDAAPRHLANLVATYTPSFLPGSVLSLEWTRMGSYWMDPENTVRYDGHDLFSLRATWEAPFGFSVFGRVINLTNARYAERASYNAFRGEEFSPGLPRTFYLGLQYTLR